MAWREGPRLAAMKVELARSDEPGMSDPVTFKGAAEADESDARSELLAATLEHVLDRALGRLYRIAEKDNADLLESYGFTDRHGRPQFVDSVVRKCEEVAQGNGFPSARALLEEIAALRGRTLKQSVTLTPVRKLWIAWKTWVTG